MSFYVEVMCDERKEGSTPGNILVHRCWSDRGDNPQGGDRKDATAEARKQGWIVRGNYAVCPGCQA